MVVSLTCIPQSLAEQSRMWLSPHFCQSNVSQVVIFLILSTSKYTVEADIAFSSLLTDITL